jgi:hypothetical protein
VHPRAAQWAKQRLHDRFFKTLRARMQVPAARARVKKIYCCETLRASKRFCTRLPLQRCALDKCCESFRSMGLAAYLHDESRLKLQRCCRQSSPSLCQSLEKKAFLDCVEEQKAFAHARACVMLRPVSHSF